MAPSRRRRTSQGDGGGQQAAIARVMTARRPPGQPLSIEQRLNDEVARQRWPSNGVTADANSSVVDWDQLFPQQQTAIQDWRAQMAARQMGEAQDARHQAALSRPGAPPLSIEQRVNQGYDQGAWMRPYGSLYPRGTMASGARAVDLGRDPQVAAERAAMPPKDRERQLRAALEGTRNVMQGADDRRRAGRGPSGAQAGSAIVNAINAPQQQSMLWRLLFGTGQPR